MVNSFKVWKHLNPDTPNDTYLDFKMCWVRETMKKYANDMPEVRGRGRAYAAEDLPGRLTGRHFPVEHPPIPNGKQKPCKRCVVCCRHTAKGKHAKESRYMCDTCNVSLCVTPCFKNYHTMTVY